MNGSRILLVEDDEDIGAELTQALAGSGHLPSLARTGAEALTAVTLTPPDLVLLDLGLPDIDGVELCRRLRAAAPDGVIAVLSASPGKVHSREDLMASVWDEHWFGPTKTLDVHISSLRRKLTKGAEPAPCIETIRGRGYRFEPRPAG